ncbi:DUF6132 family protein [Paenimyroides aestuarii]|uniref:DUF6132 family protein n=1 Tax=Paenimyroides aestuarii TaxID=2968490 RepID=A0ABY5NSN8_9FLAO|nr:DUF6132 family protein [Paenimyroides aestuarii]UUV21576.1 DUF6132 family protein [Paenimyroides aestuarii]
MRNWFKKYVLELFGIAIGAVLGYLYWKYIGCLSGTCAITSNPTNSTIYGMVMGGLLASILKPKKVK